MKTYELEFEYSGVITLTGKNLDDVENQILDLMESIGCTNSFLHVEGMCEK